MRRAKTEEMIAIVQQFNAIGHEVEAVLDVSSPRIAALLAERDALLAKLSAAIAADPYLSGERQAIAPVVNAVEGACSGTSTLIAKVAERTDALRAELRELGRGARASQAYQSASDVPGRVNARR